MKKKLRKRSRLKETGLEANLIVTMTGLTGGIAIGQTMNSLADIKKDTALEKVHHWVVGLITSLVGLSLNLMGKMKLFSNFLVALGLGIAVTDLRDMGKQLDNLADNDPLDQGLNNNDNVITMTNDIIKVD